MRALMAPEQAVRWLRTAQQAAHVGQSFGDDSPPGPLASALAHDQSDFGQETCVVGDRWLALAQRAFEVLAADLAFCGDEREQPQPDGVGQGAEECCSDPCL